MSTRFSKVLIANRGEIAVRIASTLRQLGITPVAVYSQVDAQAAHVAACAQAVPLGAAGAYLDGAAVVAAARSVGADAIHPGYGFLSENADFAEAVAAAGMTFIGPPPAAIRLMGNKTRARTAMAEAGVPTVPGNAGALAQGKAGLQEAAALAQTFGYPVMLKAAAGGGGKGMRLVHAEGELATALRAASSEARNAFGDPAIYLEKAIVRPRHIEIQIFSDAHGEAFALGERECSLQRRHQKVLEECPSPLLDAELRHKMGAVACQAARAVDYRGAGTVEFLLDAQRNFYFLEMNTRLQVEHPVTEQCFGIDLVAAQVRVAQGETLAWQQERLRPRGHAMEARLYAEDPSRNFMPSPGKVGEVTFPQTPHVRVDSGLRPHSHIPSDYDPMLAKIIAWGEDREQARTRLLAALAQTHLQGLTTNLSFLQQVLRYPPFVAGDYDTHSLQDMLSDSSHVPPPPPLDVVLAAAAIATFRRDHTRARSPQPARGDVPLSAWQRAALPSL